METNARAMTDQEWERPNGIARIEPGMDVVDSRGDLVGEVVEAAPSYVLVQQGRFFPDDVMVPIEAIAVIEAGVVRLAVTGEEALAASWHVGPPVGVGFASTDTLPLAIALGGQVEELGTTDDDAAPAGTGQGEDR